jgi:hypothetical protein
MNILVRGLLAFTCVAAAGCVGNSAAQRPHATERPPPITGEPTATQPTPPSSSAPDTAPTPAPIDPSVPVPPTPAEPATAPAPAEPVTPPHAAPWAEASPGLRVSRELRALEFDGTIPIDVHGKAPRVFLEVLVCSRDSREHESLIVTDVKPSSVHAALLMLGLVPGAPGSWQFEHATLTSTPPSGPRLNVSVRFEKDSATVTEPIESWVANLRGGPSLAERDPAQHLVFAGSRFVTRDGADTYAADADGTLIGLTAFGSETIAWTAMYHPDSAFEQPQWIADPARVPAFGAKVTVVITSTE